MCRESLGSMTAMPDNRKIGTDGSACEVLADERGRGFLKK
jgi:hypothetical protein